MMLVVVAYLLGVGWFVPFYAGVGRVGYPEDPWVDTLLVALWMGATWPRTAYQFVRESVRGE